MRRFITFWGFLRRVGKASQVALKLARVIKKRRLASDVYGSQRMGPEWVFLHVRRHLNVLDLPPMWKKGAPKIFFFFNQLMQMCNRRERGVVRFKRYQQSHIKKWTQAFHYMQTTYIYFLLCCVSIMVWVEPLVHDMFTLRLSGQPLSGTSLITLMGRKSQSHTKL